MSKEHRKYVRELKIKRDLQQACFSPDGAVQQRPQVISRQAQVDFSRIVFCPFCLCEAKLQAFLISSKEGISQSRAQCPECGNGMMMRSVTATWTPKTFAEWVFDYAGSGFWQKCKWELWKKRLQDKGWTQAFWNRYRELKGSGSDEAESYTEYMNRQGEEAAAEWNREQPEGE